MAKLDRTHASSPPNANAPAPDMPADDAVDQSELAARAAKFDRCDMATVIERLPIQIEIALEQEMPPLPGGPFKQVVLAGLGGSALPADVVNDAFADKLRIPVKVSRHYDLPPCVDDRTLVVASSFSGATEEVLHAIDQFPTDALNVVVLSSGGALTTLGRARGYPVVQIPVQGEPKGFQPRSALGYTATLLARVLHSTGLMDDPEPELETVPRFLREANIRPDAEEAGLWLKDKIPVIYTDETHLMSIARIAKIKFNETSKRPALFNALPEANHNEMIGFSKPLGKFGVLYLPDPSSHARIRQRFHVMRDVFRKEGLSHVSFREWEIPGATKIEKIFAALAFADWCSYTLALLDEVDPTPVALVESFKQELESQAGDSRNG